MGFGHGRAHPVALVPELLRRLLARALGDLRFEPSNEPLADPPRLDAVGDPVVTLLLERAGIEQEREIDAVVVVVLQVVALLVGEDRGVEIGLPLLCGALGTLGEALVDRTPDPESFGIVGAFGIERSQMVSASAMIRSVFSAPRSMIIVVPVIRPS